MSTTPNALTSGLQRTPFLGPDGQTVSWQWMKFFNSLPGSSATVVNALDFSGSDIGAQVNAAIASLLSPSSINPGGTVFIPTGTYNQTTTIVKPRNVSIVGAGEYSTVLNHTSATGWAIVIGDSTGVAFTQCQIASLTLTGVGDGGIYLGASDGSAGSPSPSLAPSSFVAEEQNINRVRIFSGFNTGIQIGNNAWGLTVFESTISLNGIGFYIPAGLPNAGERINFISCLISNNTGIGVKVGAPSANGIDVHLINCSLDFNGSYAVQNSTSATLACFVEIAGCYILGTNALIQNFGWMNIAGSYITGNNSTYLIDNQQAMSVFGGFYYQNGSGAVFNPTGLPQNQFGSFMNGSVQGITTRALAVFANNAAAIAGGLTVGAFYRTGADPSVICVVF